MDTTIYVKDVECESCEKVLRKVLERPGVDSLRFEGIRIEARHDPKKVSADDLLKIVHDKGYHASLSPPANAKWHSHIGDVERLMLKNAVISLPVLIVLEVIFVFATDRLEWLQKYGIYLALTDLVVVSLVAEWWHLHSYKATVTCMTGMMLGMILGMQAGMMIGYILGATNGFFIGALVASVMGMFFGWRAGCCCGNMGSVQGMMAGFMGGTMGAMIAVMLAASGFWWFTPWFFVANLGMLWAFSVLLIENVVADRPVERSPMPLSTFLAYCVVIAALIILVMIVGPLGPLVI